ncbi:MAG: energy transducer TonB, partial [Gluconobacter oxydans]
MSGRVQAPGELSDGLLSFSKWQRDQFRLTRREDALRWGLSFLAVLAVSGGTLWYVMRLPPPVMAIPAPPPAAIAIDMAPEPVSPPTPPPDVPPRPQHPPTSPDPAPGAPTQGTAAPPPPP